MQSSEYFQDNEKLKKVYEILGSRLFDFEAAPVQLKTHLEDFENPLLDSSSSRQVKVCKNYSTSHANHLYLYIHE